MSYFYTPWNQRFFDVFRGYRNRTMTWKGLIDLSRATVILRNINHLFKTFLENKDKTQEKLTTVPKKPLFLLLPYFTPPWLQNKTQLRKPLTGINNCCKLRAGSRVKASYQTLFVQKIASLQTYIWCRLYVSF